jgi:hypothetical protein
MMGGLAGCPASLSDPGEFESDAGHPATESEGGAPACADVPTVIFQQSCGTVGCHTSSSPAQGLDLVSPGVASRLINVPETEMPALGLLLIDPAKPQDSVILTKLQASTVPYGAVMPFGGKPLSAQEVACVAAWIDSAMAAPAEDAGATDEATASGSDGDDGDSESVADSSTSTTRDAARDSATDAPTDATNSRPKDASGEPDVGPPPKDSAGVDATDPLSLPARCTSDMTWNGATGQNMRPGEACPTCHSNFDIAGTVFPTGHEPNDCDGVNGANTGVTIVITDANGAETTLQPNSVGNFYTSITIKTPFHAKVVENGKERAMTAAQTSGSCNACHTQAGANGAPGRITLPE